LTCTYLAHHELESVLIIVIIIITIIIIVIIIIIIIAIVMIKITVTLHAGVLELIEFIRKENIKTLVEHIVDQHIERYTTVPLLPPTRLCFSCLCLKYCPG